MYTYEYIHTYESIYETYAAEPRPPACSLTPVIVPKLPLVTNFLKEAVFATINKRKKEREGRAREREREGERERESERE